MSNTHKRRSSRQGIALIVVLGLLSILVITGVAFSIAMRTERSATRAYMDIVKARHLTQTALYRVIGGELNTLIPPGTPYPQWNAYSPLQGEITMLYDRLADSPAKFIPMHLRYDIDANDLDYTDWIELRDPMNNAFYGEFAYLIVNNSGLLDANVIGAYESTNPGDPPPRRHGYDPGEIRFSPTILDGVLNPTLRAYRNAFRRFDSVPELYRLCTPTNFFGQIGSLPLRHLGHPPQSGDLPNWLRGGFANDLHVFSRYPRGYADANMRAVTNVAYIGGPPSGWTNIAAALADLTPNPIPDVPSFIAVLRDYVNQDYLPSDGNLNRMSSMPVPMINEVIISNRLVLTTPHQSGDGDNLRHIVFISVETWYPFPEAGPDQFIVQYGAAPAAGPQVGFTVPPYPNLSGVYQRLTEPGYPQPTPFAPTPNSYHVSTFTFYRDQQVNNVGGFPFPHGADVPFQTTYTLADEISVVYQGSGTPAVDRVNANWPAGMFFLNNTRAVAIGQPASLGAVAASANDPRINWDSGNRLHWWGASPTPGALNTRVRDPAEIAQYGYQLDEVERMFAARERGQLLSVGEVGYLLYDATKPWTTIRLLEPDPNDTARIIDRLTVHPEFYRRGMVNLNTQHTNALRAAFWTMPIDAYPTDPPWSDTLTQAMTDQVVAQIMSTTRANPVLNLSEIKDLLPQAFVDGLLNTVDDKFKRESLVRNSLGVLGTRHNLFTVFLAARTFAPSYNPANPEHKDNREDFVTAEQRAIVVVWRDPFITTDQANNPTRKSLVQYFHWLTDEDEL